MRKLIIGILLLITFSLVQAAESRLRLINPKGSNLKLIHLQTVDGNTAKFKGQVWVAGVFEVSWPDSGGNRRYLSYHLIPDKASIAKLPYFDFKDSQYHNTYHVQDINLKNGEAALRLVVNKKRADRFLQHRINQVKVNGKFLINTYVAGVECDSYWANANLIAYEKPKKLASVKSLGGC
jgi:hypothetical protein